MKENKYLIDVYTVYIGSAMIIDYPIQELNRLSVHHKICILVHL